jgi:hypothetical protein
MLENKMVREILGPKREEVTERWRKCNRILRDLLGLRARK